MRKIVFLHVHKCAGTAIHALMLHNIGPVAFYPTRWREPDDIAFHAQDPKLFAERVLNAAPAERAELLARLDGVEGVGGHNDAYMLSALSEYPLFSFTSLRDPMDRLVSFYFHFVHPERASHIRKHRELLTESDFESFLAFDKVRFGTDNEMVRVLSGNFLTERVDENDLDVARANLERLDTIIFQDSFTRDIYALCRRLDWTMPAGFLGAPVKKSGNRSAMEPRMSFSREAAAPFIRFDEALVAHAREIRGRRNASL